MYNSSQYCDTKSRVNKEKLTVGGSLKNSIVNSAIWGGAGPKTVLLIFQPTHVIVCLL